MNTGIKITSMILVFILGFLSCIGALFGVGYYAYTNASWDKLYELGIIQVQNKGDLFDPEADAPINEMTIQKLVEEIMSYQSLQDGLTLDYMIDRYGIKLPAGVEAILVEELRTLPLNQLASKEGTDVLLERVSVGTILNFVPAGVLSEPAQEMLKDKTLKEVVAGDYASLLSGVKLGYLLGVTYELDNEVYVPVYKDPSAPTIVELLAPIDLGRVLNVLSQGGDMLEVVHEAIADVALLQLIDSLMKVEEGPLFEMLDGKSVGEILLWDETLGAYKLDFLAALDDMRVGDLLGLVPVYSTNNPELLISWNDKEGNLVVGYMRGLASIDLSEVIGENKEINTEGLLNHLYFGDLLGYVPTFDDDGNITAWETTAGEDVETAFKNLVGKPVNDLMNGSFSITTILEGLFLGDLLGYTSEEVDGELVWKNGNTAVSGLDKVIANIDLEKMLDPDSGYSFISAFEGNLMGDLLGYTKTDGGWLNGTNEVTGIDEVIANIDIEALLNSDKDYSVTDAFDGSLLGDVLGYEYDTTKKQWYNGDNPVSVVENAIADINMGDLLAGDFKLTEAFEDTFLGDLLGYIRGDAIDPTVENVQDREYLWYEEVRENGRTERKEISGIQKELANYNLLKIMEGKQTITVEGFKIGELIGIHPETCYVYLNGDAVMAEGERMTVTIWVDDEGERASGILASIADLDVSSLNDRIQSLKISDVVEYISLNDGTEDFYALGDVTTYGEGDNAEKRVSITKTTGVLTVLAGLSVSDMSSATVVTNKIQQIQIGDVMGWCYEDGVWYTDESKKEVASGTLGALASSKIGTINDDIKSTSIGVLLGYTKVGETWYTEYNKETGKGTPVSGTLSAIVDFEVNELSGKIDTMEIGKLLGYKKNASGKWVEVTYNGNTTTEREITGIMATIAGFKVATLSSELEQMQLGTLLGWEEKNGIWYEIYVSENSSENVAATGIMKHFASLTLDGMTNNSTVSSVIGNMYVGEALSWYRNPADNKWYATKTDTTPVEGIMQSVAGMTVNSLDTGVNDLTIGKILEWEKHGDTWYSKYDANDASQCVKASGIMVNLAHLKISDLKNGSSVSSAIQNAKLGEAMGWYEKNGTWYTDAACTKAATGAMASMASTPVSGLDARVKSLTIAEALGFAYNKNEKAYYNNGVKVTGIMASIADTPLSDINNKIQTTVVGELLEYKKGDAQHDDAKLTPYDSNDNPADDVWYHLVTKNENDTTKQVWEKCSKIQNYLASHSIDGLDAALTSLTIGNVVDYSASDDAKLSMILGKDWKNLTIPAFFQAVINLPFIPGT